MNMTGDIIRFLNDTSDIFECICGDCGNKFAVFKNHTSGGVITLRKESLLDMEDIEFLDKSFLIQFMMRG